MNAQTKPGKIFRILSYYRLEYPRMSRTPKAFLYFYYFWKERLTATGRVLAVFLFFSLFFVWVPGAFAVKAFLLTASAFLIVSIFTLFPLKKIAVRHVQIPPVKEGDAAKISAKIQAEKNFAAVKLGCFRMHPALKFQDEEKYESLRPSEEKEFFAFVRTSRRGAFEIPSVAAVVPNALGITSILKPASGNFELVVQPRAIPVGQMHFLAYGKSGRAFAPYLQPSFKRGLDFIGIREYREGDSLRDLHHKAFAKYGKPFTKEFAAERGEGIVLLLDVSCQKVADKIRVENAVRLTAGIAQYLVGRSLLGRFFIADREIPLPKDAPHDSFAKILDALARAPYPEIGKKFPKPQKWNPAARPMAPVLSVSVLPLDSPLITKQIVVSEKNGMEDDKFFLSLSSEGEVHL